MSLESERRAIGQRLIDERAAIRDSMRASRASTFKRDLNTLETSPRKEAGLSIIEPKGARPATVGRAYWSSSKEPVSGGGIASPLTEGAYSSREFHPTRYLTSTDGFFSLEVKPLSKLVMTDAGGNPVVQIFSEPT